MEGKLNPHFLVSKLHSLPWDNISKSPCDELTTQRLDSYWTGLTLPHTTLIASFWQTVISVFFLEGWGVADPLQKPPTVESLNTENPETFTHSSCSFIPKRKPTVSHMSRLRTGDPERMIPVWTGPTRQQDPLKHNEPQRHRDRGRSLTPTFTEAQCWSPSSYRACS